LIFTGGGSSTRAGGGVAASAVPAGATAVVAISFGAADGSSVARKTPSPITPATSRTDSIPASMGRSTALA
jgi:hypothetical protein